MTQSQIIDFQNKLYLAKMIRRVFSKNQVHFQNLRKIHSDLPLKFDERDESVKYLLELAINACKKSEKYIGICGQGPSDHLDFAQWLMKKNIDSISLNPDTVLDTLDNIKNN